jgi:hypothetical protein
MGASTVAGAISMLAMDTEVGTVRAARTFLSASPDCSLKPGGLSQNFFTFVFYFLSESSPTCDNADDLEFLMRTIRQILLTEYIGAILVAVLVADSFSSLFTTVVAQISYHLYFAEHNIPREGHRLSTTYSLLETLTRVALYLISAYLLAQWLYPAKTEVAERRGAFQEDQKTGERM